jgi:histidinol dehydrogenase
MNIERIVRGIIKEVARRGDVALCQFARQFDGVSLRPSDLRITPGALRKARDHVSPFFLKAIKECATRVRSYAELEKRRLPGSWIQKKSGCALGQAVHPVDSVGLYIPGGRFPYPSTILMTAIPAQVAGVRRIVMMSPPRHLTPEVLVAAAEVGLREIYRVGGAAAIAALALGTQRIRPVDFIVGPGNRFVTEAKRQLYGKVGIDLLAGPSEVVIIADRSTPLKYIEEDLLAQAEHDPEARGTLCSLDRSLIHAVRRRLGRKNRSKIRFLFAKSASEAVTLANAITPEHLELLIPHAERYLPQIRHAGAIFLGPTSPAALGDYVAGPSHVLPTHGAARFSSGLSVATFLKRSSVIGFTGRSSEKAQWQAAIVMAQAEGMEHHARSLQHRMQRVG